MISAPLDSDGCVDYPEIVSNLWTTRLLFYRPDPLGYCVIISDMIRFQAYSKLSVEERQRLKGYMK